MNLEMQEMHLDMNQLPNLMNYAKVGSQPFISLAELLREVMVNKNCSPGLDRSNFSFGPFTFRVRTVHFHRVPWYKNRLKT